eukprot:gene10512-10671_t
MAAASPATAVSLDALLQPDLAFSTATYVMVPLYFIIAFFPRSKIAKVLISSPVLPLAFAVAYAALAWQAWQAGAFTLVEAAVRSAQPWPDAVALAAMFQDKTLAALAWMHLLLLDFLTARAVLMDGLRQLVPTAHSVLLCFMVGPLGLLSHLVTRMVVHKTRGDSPAVASSSMWS